METTEFQKGDVVQCHDASGLVRRAPASPAQEAWVPRKGDRVRVKSATASPTRSAMGEGGITVGYVGEVQSFAGEHEVEVNGWWINRCDLEPAPMPSGSAGKECPECGEVGKHRSSCAVLADKLDAALEHQRELNTKREWDSEKHPAPGFWPSLDERIAAARAELDQPSAERRARAAPSRGAVG